MLPRPEQLNRQIHAGLPQPLRTGIGIHFSEAIVGMGPPRSQIITATGDAVNTGARLEGLTKEFDCQLIPPMDPCSARMATANNRRQNRGLRSWAGP
jgi:adenylate cyclase